MATQYLASEYAPGGKRADEEPRTEFQGLVQYYMAQIYIRHGIDYAIPKTNIPKYYKRLKVIMERLGSFDRAKQYINWYLGHSRFETSGYSLDLMVSDSLVNQFISADPRDVGDGMPDYFLDWDEVDHSKGNIE